VEHLGNDCFEVHVYSMWAVGALVCMFRTCGGDCSELQV